MRILYILPSLANTAPIQIALALVETSIKNGFQVEVYYFDEINDVEFPCIVKKINIKEPVAFDDFDIIHTHLRRPDQYVARYADRIKKAKTISTIHCDIYEDLKYSYGSVIATIYFKRWIGNLKKFNCTVQISEFLMKKYDRELHNNYLIHNGVDVNIRQKNEYRKIIDIIENYHKSGYKVLLSYSSLIKRKGNIQIINALECRGDLAYLCVGEGKELSRLTRVSEKKNINGRVCFCGFINFPYNLVPYVDVVVVPSYSESFCLALHEAGTVGASIVCSNIPAFTDAFTDKEVSFFELDDIESLLQAIEIALKKEKNESLIMKEARLYTKDQMQSKYIELYKELIDKYDMRD